MIAADESSAASIKFGKYRDSHPCAAQGMTILAGPTPHNLHEIGRGSLRNDSLAETQKVKWKSLVWTGDEVMLGKKRRHGSKSRSEQVRFVVFALVNIEGGVCSNKSCGIAFCSEIHQVRFRCQAICLMLMKDITSTTGSCRDRTFMPFDPAKSG